MWNAALDRTENEVMRALLTLSAGKARFLASPAEMLSLVKGRCDEAALERTLLSLAQDGYFDFIATDRKGERRTSWNCGPRARRLSAARTTTAAASSCVSLWLRRAGLPPRSSAFCSNSSSHSAPAAKAAFAAADPPRKS